MKSISKSVQVKKDIEDDTTFNKLLELQSLLKKESALKELFIKTCIETNKNIDKECIEIYKKKIEVLNILQKINNKGELNDNSKNKNSNKSLKEYCLVENNYDYLEVLNTYIPKLLNYLWEDPKLVANLLMVADKDDTNKYLAPLICNNFYENILSSNYIEDPLMYIIYLLLDNEINNIENIKDSSSFLNNTQCSFLLGQLIDKKDVKDFFKLILEDIIEDLGSNKFNFDISEIEQSQIKKRKTVNKIYEKEIEKVNTMKEKSNFDYSKSELINTRTFSSNTINNINEPDKLQIMKSTADYQLFYSYYMADIPLSELKRRKKEAENTLDINIEDYINYLISNANQDEKAYSQENLINSIADRKNSEIILVLYQQDFMKAIEFIDKLFQNLISNYRIVPYSIKCVCKIITELIENKFPDVSTIEKNLLISKFFFEILLIPIILKPDINALINNYIISNNIIYNAKIICNVILQFVSFKLYKNSSMLQGGNYTPFNIFFLDKISQIFKFYEKIIKVKLPSFIDEFINNKISIDEYEFNYFKENPNEVVFHKSMLLNIKEFNAVFKNLYNNKEKLFSINKEKKGFFKKIFNKGNKDKDKSKNKDNNKDNNPLDKKTKSIISTLDKINSSDNKKFLEELCKQKDYVVIQKEKIKEDGLFSKKKVIYEEEKKQKIQYFHITEILFNEKYKNIFSLEQKNPYYLIKELKDLSTNDLKIKNNIIKAKNFLSSILYNYRILVKSDFIEGTTNDTISILKELKLFMKSSNFLIDNKIPSEWYVSSLLECLKKLKQDYKQNDYEKLFNELINELHNSIKQYNFENLSIFIDKMKYANRNKMYFNKIKGIYMDIELNNKANEIIQNDEINIELSYKLNDKKREFDIFKKDLKDKQLDFLDSFTFKDNNKGKLCKTIELFTKYFPNLNKRVSFDGKDIDENEIGIFQLQEEIHIPQKLKIFFNIISKSLKNKIKDEKELNIINDKIYDYVMSRIYPRIYPKKANILDDQILQKTCMLSWVEPHNIINSNTHFDFDLVMPDINKFFNSIRIEKSPRKKLLNLTNIFSSINNLLKFSGKNMFGVDDQILILTYSFIKARPMMIYTDCKFMDLYIGDKKNKSEDNTLSQIKTVIDLIKNVSYKSLFDVEEEEFNQKCQLSFKDYMENYYENQ